MPNPFDDIVDDTKPAPGNPRNPPRDRIRRRRAGRAEFRLAAGDGTPSCIVRAADAGSTRGGPAMLDKTGDDTLGRPRNPPPPPERMPWDAKALAKQVEEILAAVEAPPVDERVRLTFQKMIYRADKFGGDGRGNVTLLLRTILESEGNGADALVEPVVSAVSMCMRPEWTGLGLKWIETFDGIPLKAILQTMRSLDLFSEQSIGHYFSIALRNKLLNIFGPAVLPKPAKPAKVKARRESKNCRVVFRHPRHGSLPILRARQAYQTSTC
jgi:hypothetical protein